MVWYELETCHIRKTNCGRTNNNSYSIYLFWTIAEAQCDFLTRSSQDNCWTESAPTTSICDWDRDMRVLKDPRETKGKGLTQLLKTSDRSVLVRALRHS